MVWSADRAELKGVVAEVYPVHVNSDSDFQTRIERVTITPMARKRKIPQYGEKRDYSKIHLSFLQQNGENRYLGVTTWSRTLSEAKKHASKSFNLPEARISAWRETGNR